jgi:RNA polymerase sigma factor (sigma-70 family)
MIFECESVTELVLEWQSSHDIATLEYILEGSRKLVEVIASSYSSIYREDLIQESFLRIQYAIQFYNPNIANLHNYLTTVIRNTCVTYLQKQAKEPDTIPDLQVYGDLDNNDNIDDTLSELIIRNRTRFPSIPVSDVDDATEMIYYALMESGYNKSRGIVIELMKNYTMSRHIATVVYHSTMVYLRACNTSYADVGNADLEEFTLLQDLRDVLGEKMFKRVSLMFSGMYIKLP